MNLIDIFFAYYYIPFKCTCYCLFWMLVNWLTEENSELQTQSSDVMAPSSQTEAATKDAEEVKNVSSQLITTTTPAKPKYRSEQFFNITEIFISYRLIIAHLLIIHIYMQAWTLSEARGGCCDYICKGTSCQQCVYQLWGANSMPPFSLLLFNYYIKKKMVLIFDLCFLSPDKCNYWCPWWRCIHIPASLFWKGDVSIRFRTLTLKLTDCICFTYLHNII